MAIDKFMNIGLWVSALGTNNTHMSNELLCRPRGAMYTTFENHGSYQRLKRNSRGKPFQRHGEDTGMARLQ